MLKDERKRKYCVGLHWFLFAAIALPLLAPSTSLAGQIVKTDLFNVGDHGYRLYHIPGIAVTAKGTVLAWCEARKHGGDWDDIHILLRRSTDDGLTWSKAKKIAQVEGPKKKNPVAVRLRVNPKWVTYNNPVLIPDRDGTVHMVFCLEYMRCFYQRSDDDGKTWQASEIAIPCADQFRNPNETVAVQLADGTVMLNARNESKARRRIIVTSPDGATQWSEPRFQEDLVDPVCMAGLTRYDHGGKSLLLFSNPNTLKGRRNVTVRVSEDEGETWPISRSVEPGYSAYSDINVTPRGTILCFYGRSKKPHFASDRLTVARFDLDWLLHDLPAGLEDEERRQEVDFVKKGQALSVHEIGGQWSGKDGALVRGGTAASLVIGGNHFGFDGGGKVLLMTRTCEGHLWASWSEDDGRSWSDPKPTSLVHPDAPRMLFHHPDGKTLVAFHHNRHSGGHFKTADRGEIWISLSTDEGHTWSEPRFVCANALAAGTGSDFLDHQCSYLDAFVDGDDFHLFVPHRWKPALHLTLKASDIERLPTKEDLQAAARVEKTLLFEAREPSAPNHLLTTLVPEAISAQGRHENAIS